MTEADDSAAAAPRDDAESKLNGLERLRLTGLVTEERYQAMRQRLLGGDSAPAPAWKPDPPAQRPPTPAASRTTILAVVAAGVVLFAGAAAVALGGHSSTPTTPAAAHSSPTPTPASPTPTPTQDLTVFGQQYVADISPLNRAWAAFDDALANAPSGPACGCPPGEFNARTVMPSFNALLTTYATTINDLQVMQQELTGQAAADCGRLVQDMQASRVQLQGLLVPGTPTDAQVAAVDRFNTAHDVELNAALTLRADLHLPPPTPAA